jgi:hypothetical protein
VAKVPVFTGSFGKRPLWGKRGGIWVPLWADPSDPCACCEGCPPCEGTCTTGWAAGGFTAVDCPSRIRLLDNSTPPSGYCYSFSQWRLGSLVYESDTRYYDLPWTFGNCISVELTSVAYCCDYPDHCGGCSDTTTYEISPQFCCCYGGHCVDGNPVINWPAEVSVTIDEFFSTASEQFCHCTKEDDDWISSRLPGSFILPFAGEVFGVAQYELTIDEGAVDPECCSRLIGGEMQTGHRYVHGIASISCEGILYAGVSCLVGPPLALENGFFACHSHGLGAYIYSNSWHPPGCHGTYDNPDAYTHWDSGAFCNHVGYIKGIHVSW